MFFTKYNNETQYKAVFSITEINRKVFVLETLLKSSVVLASISFLLTLKDFIVFGKEFNGISPLTPLVVTAFLYFLYRLEKTGRYKVVTYLFIVALLIPCLIASFYWGSVMPQALVMYTLIVVITSICLGTRHAFLLTLFISFYLILIAHLQITGRLAYDYTWRNEIYDTEDAFTASVTIFVIFIVSWLSNREIESSLKRALQSEEELKTERDLLELRVEERTEELKIAQLEKLRELNKFSEIGKITSGLIHDLVTPLTVASLNLENLKQTDEKLEVSSTQRSLERAIKATNKMESFIVAVRKQFINENAKTEFEVLKEIKDVTLLLDDKINELNVKINIACDAHLKLFGSSAKFCQVFMNLLTNAIDAFEVYDNKKPREISIMLTDYVDKVLLSVVDNGMGISSENCSYIFQPLFTTKPSTKGTGLGLSSCKEIIENHFDGTITFESLENIGTKFFISFPKTSELNRKN